MPNNNAVNEIYLKISIAAYYFLRSQSLVKHELVVFKEKT